MGTHACKDYNFAMNHCKLIILKQISVKKVCGISLNNLGKWIIFLILNIRNNGIELKLCIHHLFKFRNSKWIKRKKSRYNVEGVYFF